MRSWKSAYRAAVRLVHGVMSEAPKIEKISARSRLRRAFRRGSPSSLPATLRLLNRAEAWRRSTSTASPAYSQLASTIVGWLACAESIQTIPAPRASHPIEERRRLAREAARGLLHDYFSMVERHTGIPIHAAVWPKPLQHESLNRSIDDMNRDAGALIQRKRGRR